MNKKSLVLYPAPGAGHLVAMVELGKLILRHHGGEFSVHILVTTGLFDTPSIHSYLDKISETYPSITILRLPSVPVNFSATQSPLATIIGFINSNASNVLKSLQDLKKICTIRALVIDFFCTSVFPIACDMGIETYYLWTSSAGALAAHLYLPKIIEQIGGRRSFKDLAGTEFNIPGLASIPAINMPEPLLDKNDASYDETLRFCLHLPKSRGILVNTFDELEPTALKAIKDGACSPEAPTPAVYCVGPLISEPADHGHQKSSQDGDDCLSWLDEQPDKSVVFLCFGSQGTFPPEQLKEIAKGLERSGQRFLWVVKDQSPKASPSETDVETTSSLLPVGFTERTKNRGMVLRSWAPQVAVLNHGSIGGFVTHCGWNSILEAVIGGVPMAAWPLYAEQHLNKAALVEDMKMAIPVEQRQVDGFVTAEEVEKRIRELMESGKAKELKDRSQKMKEIALTCSEKSGSSASALAKLIQVWVEEEAEPTTFAS